MTGSSKGWQSITAWNSSCEAALLPRDGINELWKNKFHGLMKQRLSAVIARAARRPLWAMSVVGSEAAVASSTKILRAMVLLANGLPGILLGAANFVAVMYTRLFAYSCLP